MPTGPPVALFLGMPTEQSPALSTIGRSTLWTPSQQTGSSAIETFFASAENMFYRESGQGVITRELTRRALEWDAQSLTGYAKPLTQEQWKEQAGDDEDLASRWKEGYSIASLEWFRSERDIDMMVAAQINARDHGGVAIAGSLAGGVFTLDNILAGQAGRGGLGLLARINARSKLTRGIAEGTILVGKAPGTTMAEIERALYLKSLEELNKKISGSFTRRVGFEATANLAVDVPNELTAQFIRTQQWGEESDPGAMAIALGASVIAPLGMEGVRAIGAKGVRAVKASRFSQWVHETPPVDETPLDDIRSINRTVDEIRKRAEAADEGSNRPVGSPEAPNPPDYRTIVDDQFRQLFSHEDRWALLEVRNRLAEAGQGSLSSDLPRILALAESALGYKLSPKQIQGITELHSRITKGTTESNRPVGAPKPPDYQTITEDLFSLFSPEERQALLEARREFSKIIEEPTSSDLQRIIASVESALGHKASPEQVQGIKELHGRITKGTEVSTPASALSENSILNKARADQDWETFRKIRDENSKTAEELDSLIAESKVEGSTKSDYAEVAPAAKELSRLVRGIWGKEVRFFTADAQPFFLTRDGRPLMGQVHSSSPSIYVRLDRGGKVLDLYELVGHELFHRLETDSPGTARAFVSELMSLDNGRLRPVMERLFRQQFPEGLPDKLPNSRFLQDEFAATALGQLFRNPEFHREIGRVFYSTKSDPKILARIRAFFIDLLDSLRRAVRSTSDPELAGSLSHIHRQLAEILVPSPHKKDTPIYPRGEVITLHEHRVRFFDLLAKTDEAFLKQSDEAMARFDNDVLTDLDEYAELDQTRTVAKRGLGRPVQLGRPIRIPDRIYQQGSKAIRAFAAANFSSIKEAWVSSSGLPPAEVDKALFGYRVSTSESGVPFLSYKLARHSDWASWGEVKGSAYSLAVDARIHQLLETYQIHYDNTDIEGLRSELNAIFNGKKDTSDDPVVAAFLGSDRFEEVLLDAPNLLSEGATNLQLYDSFFLAWRNFLRDHEAELKAQVPDYDYKGREELFITKSRASKSQPEEVRALREEAWSLFTARLQDISKKGGSRFSKEIDKSVPKLRRALENDTPHELIDRPFVPLYELDGFIVNPDGSLARDAFLGYIKARYEAVRASVEADMRIAFESARAVATDITATFEEVTGVIRTDESGLPVNMIEEATDAIMRANFTEKAYNWFLNQSRYAKADPKLKKMLEASYRDVRDPTLLALESLRNQETPAGLSDHIKISRDLIAEQRMADSDAEAAANGFRDDIEANRVDPEQQSRSAQERVDRDNTELRSMPGVDDVDDVPSARALVQQETDGLELVDHIAEVLDPAARALRVASEVEPPELTAKAQEIDEAAVRIAAGLSVQLRKVNTDASLFDTNARLTLSGGDALLAEEIAHARIPGNVPAGMTPRQFVQNRLVASAYHRLRQAVLDINARYDGELSQSADQINANFDGRFVKTGLTGRKTGKTVTPRNDIEAQTKASSDSATAPIIQAARNLGIDRTGTPASDEALATVLDVISGRKVNPEHANTVKSLTDAIKAAVENARLRLNKAGANIRHLSDFAFSRVYNPGKIRLDPSGFANFLRENADWDRIARTVGPNSTSPGGKPEFNVEAYIQAFTEFILKGGLDRVDFTDPKPGSGLSSFHRSLFFKSGRADIEFDRAFGSGDLLSTIIGQVHRRTTRAVLMENYGPNFDINLQKVPAARKVAKLVDQVLGRLDSPVDEATSTWGQNFRALSHLAVGWTSGLAQLQDYANLARSFREMGVGPRIGNFVDFLKRVATDDSGLTPEGKLFLEANGAAGESILSAMQHESLATFSGRGWAGRVMNRVSEWNGAQRITRVIQRAYVEQAGVHLAKMADLAMAKKFDPTDPDLAQFTRWAEAVGLTGRELMQMARHVDTVEGIGRGERVLLPSMIPDRALREKLSRALRNGMEGATMTPGARENVMLHFGTQAGTPQGEVLRAIGMYKRYLLTSFTRGRQRWALYDLKPGASASPEFHRAIWMGQSLAVGYLVMSMIDVLNGKEPLTFLSDDQRNMENIHRIMVRSGAFLIANGLDTAGVNMDFSGEGPMINLGSTILGPGLGSIARAAGQAGSPQPRSNERALRTLVNGFTPFSTVPGWNPLKHEVVGSVWGDYESVQDSVLRYLEERTGQSNIFAP